MTVQNLLVELLVEELPPKVLRTLGEAFAETLSKCLEVQGLVTAGALSTRFATPRRLAVHVQGVSAQASDKVVVHKLMPVGVGLDASGNATPALLKRLLSFSADASALPRLKRAMDGKSETLFLESVVTGVTLATGLQKAIDEAIARLPIPKLMTYQLAGDCEFPGWTSVSFVRPAHGLVALHGSDIVPVQALGLRAGNTTEGHRFEALTSPLVLSHADQYASILEKEGAVIAGFEARRRAIVDQLSVAAARVGGGVKPIDDDALLDEVTALVERPNVLVCAFDKRFLDVPQECLVLTMKANQKYFPLLDLQGKLTNRFLVVSNISPFDPSAVVSGNERVVRPRLADAEFFFEQDRKRTLASRVDGLAKVVYHNKLGTQRERTERVRALARTIALSLWGPSVSASADRAALLAKTDLSTDMVGEFPALQGVMGAYYARHDGELEEVAIAIEDHYKPRFSGDELPRNKVALAVALADKLETLAGMFGVGNVPSGDKDPYALRRHALGVMRMLIEHALSLDIDLLVSAAFASFSTVGQEAHNDLFLLARQHGENGDHCAPFDGKALERLRQLLDFIYERLAGSLREQGYRAQEVDAVLMLRPRRLADVPQRMAAVRAFASLPEAAALAAANKRIANILKKAGDVDPHVSELLLLEPAEVALYAAMKEVTPLAAAQFEAGDYTVSLQTLAALRAPTDAFFDSVMVNAEEIDLRLNRQGLLKSLYNAMNQVADLSKLAA